MGSKIQNERFELKAEKLAQIVLFLGLMHLK
jgi:hypothetical protein